MILVMYDKSPFLLIEYPSQLLDTPVTIIIITTFFYHLKFDSE